jgi:Pyruvate/2-oxoacid:ferredoxin oxidoreductase delta subunit
MSEKKEILTLSDLPSSPRTLGAMSWNRTGLWRYLTPEVQNKIPPCRHACPAGLPIPDFLIRLEKGDVRGALEAILGVNPLPAVTGRLCYHPCQTDCLRRKLDRSIPVKDLERYVADQGQGRVRGARKKGKGVAVVVFGAGPMGLTCAYFLGREGYAVTVLEPTDRAGGFLVEASQDHLPPGVLDREVERLVRLSGIRIRLGQKFHASEVSGILRESSLVVMDPTAHPKGSEPFMRLNRAWGEVGRGRETAKILEPRLDPAFSGFKPSRVAHAVGLGREMAERAKGLLSGADEGEAGPKGTVGPDEIRFDLFSPERPARGRRGRELTAKGAKYEAERCLSCGTCNLCRKCALYCPDVSVGYNPETHRMEVDAEHCKGCGICAFECPRGVITMEDRP